MTARRAADWTTTTLTALVFLSGGAAYLTRAAFAVPGVIALSYPSCFVTLLGAWKVLGDLAVLAPRLSRLMEWVYADIAFDLTGATFSHAAPNRQGHRAARLLRDRGRVMGSRPGSRMLRAAAAEPAPAMRNRAVIVPGAIPARAVDEEP